MVKTPLEQAIAEKTDKRARYEKSRRDAGLIKTSMWVHKDKLEELRAIVVKLNKDACDDG